MHSRGYMVCAGLALAVVTSAAASDEACSGSSNQTQINTCAAESYKAADETLNVTYKALVAKVSKAGAASLVSAQRAWLSYRDAQCNFETLGRSDGSIYPAIRASCLAKLTQAQTKLLDQQLHCEEGDLSCGGQ